MTAAATPELFSTLLGALQYQAIAYKATERPARYREHPCPIFRFSALLLRTATLLCRHAKCAELAADIAEFTLDPSHVVSRQP